MQEDAGNTTGIVVEAPGRLDRVVASSFGLSRREARQLLDLRAVRLGAWTPGPRNAGDTVPAGTALTAALHRLRPRPADPLLPLRLLQVTPDAVVVDKPAGLPVHPLHPAEADTLLQRVCARYPEVAGAGGEGPLRGGTVHRLDTDTGGCVVFARNADAWRRLRAAFTEHTVLKLYTALVRGAPVRVGSWSAHLRVQTHRPARVAVVSPDSEVGGAPDASATRRCTLDVLDAVAESNTSRLTIRLGTGFLHQIRVMLSHAGHPVVGDRIYGAAAEREGAIPLRLHAHRLALPTMGLDAASPAPW